MFPFDARLIDVLAVLTLPRNQAHSNPSRVRHPSRGMDTRKRCTDEQIIGVIKHATAANLVKDVARKHGFSDAVLYLWQFMGVLVQGAQIPTTGCPDPGCPDPDNSIAKASGHRINKLARFVGVQIP